MNNPTIKFENRNVVLNGQSFFICVPKVWASSLGLKGKEPFVVEWNKSDDSLTIKRMEVIDDTINRATGNEITSTD